MCPVHVEVQKKVKYLPARCLFFSFFFKVRAQTQTQTKRPSSASHRFQSPVSSCSSPHTHNDNNNGVWANLKLLFILLKITYSSKKFRQLFTISTKDTRYDEEKEVEEQEEKETWHSLRCRRDADACGRVRGTGTGRGVAEEGQQGLGRGRLLLFV